MNAARSAPNRLPAWGWCALTLLGVLLVVERPPLTPAVAQAEPQPIDARVQRQEMIVELKLLNAQAKQTNALLEEIRSALTKKSTEK